MMRCDTFEYTIPGYEPFEWNVNAAKAAVEAGEVLALTDMTLDVMADVVAKNYVDADHVDRVNPDEPGIGAPIINPELTPRGISYVLIDGTHRCAKALREGRPFRVNLLNDDGAARSLLRAPADLVPFPWKAQ